MTNQTHGDVVPASEDELIERLEVVRKNPDVGEATVDDRCVLAHEGWASPVVLDPLSATVWSFFDGDTSLSEVLEDLLDVFGEEPGLSEAYLAWLVRALQESGFLQGDPSFRVPRRLYPSLEPSSCLGRRLGVRSADHMRVTIGDRSFRLSSTDPLNDCSALRPREPRRLQTWKRLWKRCSPASLLGSGRAFNNYWMA